MTFLAPYNVVWALVAVAVLLLYLVRLGGRRLDVSAYLLWQCALARRTGWSRVWQRWVSLAVALAFVGLLVLALTRPFWSAAFARARSVVLVIDASASMNATDVAPSRLTYAKDLARRIVERLERDERAAVVSAGAGVSLACGFTRDTQRIRGAVDAVPASEGPTRVVDAVALARRMVAAQPNPQIIVLTDGAFEGAERLAAADDLDVVVVAGDAAADNVGITRLATRPTQVGDSTEREVFVEVANFGALPVDCKLITSVAHVGENDSPAVPLEFGRDATWGIPAGSSITSIVRLTPRRAMLVAVSLDRDDVLPADNRAQILVPALTRKRVLVVAGADSPVAVALSGLDDAEVQVVDGLPDDPDLAAVTVFHGRVPETLPAGPTLVVEPDASCDLWQMGDASGVARRVEGRVNHVKQSPLLAGIDLSRAVMEEKVALQLAAEFEPLVVDESETPLYLLARRPNGAGSVLVFTARLAKAKSDLTLRRDFPLLLANAVRWLAGAGQGVHEATSTADLVQLTPSPDARTLVSPDGRRTPLAADQSLVGPLARGGLWSVTAIQTPPLGEAGEAGEAGNSGVDLAGSSEPGPAPPTDMAQPPESVIAVSLLDAAESDIRPRLAPTPLPDHLLAGGPSFPLWVWLVVLAGLICLVEWYLYHRRILV